MPCPFFFFWSWTERKRFGGFYWIAREKLCSTESTLILSRKLAFEKLFSCLMMLLLLVIRSSCEFHTKRHSLFFSICVINFSASFFFFFSIKKKRNLNKRYIAGAECWFPWFYMQLTRLKMQPTVWLQKNPLIVILCTRVNIIASTYKTTYQHLPLLNEQCCVYGREWLMYG